MRTEAEVQTKLERVTETKVDPLDPVAIALQVSNAGLLQWVLGAELEEVTEQLRKRATETMQRLMGEYIKLGLRR